MRIHELEQQVTHITLEAFENFPAAVLQADTKLETPRDTQPSHPFDVR
jgi:hypothetical protein